jgi:hypothetical protein
VIIRKFFDPLKAFYKRIKLKAGFKDEESITSESEASIGTTFFTGPLENITEKELFFLKGEEKIKNEMNIFTILQTI